MKNMIKILVIGAAITGFSASVSAKGYGQAGCGLGAQLMGPKSAQIFAATTNSSLYNQLFAITSGTSECTDDAVIKAELEQKIYVLNNFEGLQKDMARGKGENLNSFAFLMGCSADSVQGFNALTHKNYANIFGAQSGTPEIVIEKVKTIVGSDKSLASSCSRLP